MSSKEKFDPRSVPVYVTSVSFHGLRKTNSDFIKKQLTSLVKSKTMSELLKNSNELKNLLLDAYSIQVFVEEKKPNTMKAQWTLNTGGAMRIGGYYSLNNIFHRAERLQIDLNAGRDASHLRSAAFIKPMEFNPNIKFSFGGSDGCYDHWWSRILRHESTAFAEISAPSFLGLHKLQMANIWRKIESSGTTTPFDVRLESGDSLKLNLLHQLEFDSRSDRVFPDSGVLLRLTQELAFVDPPPPPSPYAVQGLEAASSSPPSPEGDRAVQLRMDSMFQLPFRLTNWLVAELTFGAGFIHSLSAHPVSIADRFFMGGPLDLRGYRHFAVGPSAPKLVPLPVYADTDVATDAVPGQETPCPVGALGSAIGGLHLYTRLPFVGQSRDSMASAFRLHAFAMAGSLLSDPVRAVRSAKSLGQMNRALELMNFQPRYVLGAGLIVRFANVVRMELNYCVPMNPRSGDGAQPGFQIGIGLTHM